MAAAGLRRAGATGGAGRVFLRLRSRRAEERELFFYGAALTFGTADFFSRRPHDLLETVMTPAAAVFVNRHNLAPF